MDVTFDKTDGYMGTKNIEDLTRGYEDLLAKAWELKYMSGLTAVTYTQLTDLETECNGLLTYDRVANKIIAERAAAVNQVASTQFPFKRPSRRHAAAAPTSGPYLTPI